MPGFDRPLTKHTADAVPMAQWGWRNAFIEFDEMTQDHVVKT
jgi:hypothetical protein